MLNSSNELITKPEGMDEDVGLVKDKYFFSDAQAQAILEMKLSRLTALEQDKITSDYKELLNLIKELQKNTWRQGYFNEFNKRRIKWY